MIHGERITTKAKLNLKLVKAKLCDYSNAYMLVKKTITFPNTAAAVAATKNGDRKVIFRKCAPFTDCINEINNTQADNAQDVDVLIEMHNLIEYCDNYSKASASLW